MPRPIIAGSCSARLRSGFGWLALADLLAAADPPPLRARPATQPARPAAAALPAEGEARHLPVHARRPVAGGYVRLQAAARPPTTASRCRSPKPRVVSAQPATCSSRRSQFQQHGQSGAWVSRAVPAHRHVRRRPLLHQLDARLQLAPRRRAARTAHRHRDTFVRPSMGSWITYGLGTENRDLPGFVTICPTLTHGGVNNWIRRRSCPPCIRRTPLGQRRHARPARSRCHS